MDFSSTFSDSSTSKTRTFSDRDDESEVASQTAESTAASSSISHSNLSFAAPLDNQLLHIQTNMRHSNFFLGNPRLLKKVEWTPSGRQIVLIKKQTEENEQLELAILEWIGEISPRNFWLYACAGWNGERGPHNTWDKRSPFETSKSKGQVRCPSNPTLAADWNACTANFTKLMEAAKTTPQKTALSILHDNEVRIRHATFQVSHVPVCAFSVTRNRSQPKEATSTDDAADEGTSADEDNDTVLADNDLGPAFSIDNMPCKFDNAKDALQILKEGGQYEFSPLPATSINGKPVPPKDYEKRLIGATVLVRVTMKYDCFEKKGYQFYADINSLTILRGPKIVLGIDPVSCPSKKSRFDMPSYIKKGKGKA